MFNLYFSDNVLVDIFEDFVSPVAAAATFLHTAVSKRKQVLDPTMNFCVHLLNLPEGKRDPKQKDGVLHMIGTLGDILLKVHNYLLCSINITCIFKKFGIIFVKKGVQYYELRLKNGNSSQKPSISNFVIFRVNNITFSWGFFDPGEMF